MTQADEKPVEVKQEAEETSNESGDNIRNLKLMAQIEVLSKYRLKGSF